MAVLRRFAVAAQPLIRSSLRRTRSYGSAAAQLDYDYDYDYEYEESTHRNNPVMEESEGSVLRRGVQWVVMGDPMAQRHVYADWLSNLLGVPHISVGTLVRQELNPRSTLYKQIAGAVNEGKLVPEEVIFGLLSKRLEEGYCRGESGFILDGIPRTKIQAEILDKVVDIDLVLNLKCTDGWVSKQDRGAGLYSPQDFLCKGPSGINARLQPKGGHFRSSSTMNDVCREKLHVHAEQIKPVEEYYKKQRKLLDFQVAGGPGETWKGLLAALHLQHMNAVGSSTQLSAGC